MSVPWPILAGVDGWLASFPFIDPGPLVDRELELVTPAPHWVDDLLIACRHPLTAALMPREAKLTRAEIDDFLAEAPMGRFPGDPLFGRVAAYQFWVRLRHGAQGPGHPPPLKIAGGVSVRVGRSATVDAYYGQIGYHIYPAARGQRYAYRATKLILPLLRYHGFDRVCLTCDPQNFASRRTIELLGGSYVETVDVPPEDPLYVRGEVRKMRYLLKICD